MNVARVRTPEYALFYCRVGTGIDIALGRDYVVEFDYGFDYAELIEFGSLEKIIEDRRIPGFKVVRALSDKENKTVSYNRNLAEEIRNEFCEILRRAQVEAKIVHVRTSLDRRRIFIRYFAKMPLNLNKFTRPLEKRHGGASVNLWQVGVRNEARLIGCLGQCGREACCCSWMKHEGTVNLKMAKNQGIPLNPASLNGTCNRLKCCFRYENSVYEEAVARLPALGTSVVCEVHDDFKGRIINRDILRAKLVVRSPEGKILTVDASDVKITKGNKNENNGN
ncbi:MAG: regulatory iron-sulfur-containing complex subunit RicT [Kiritimatiellia bacterium]